MPVCQNRKKKSAWVPLIFDLFKSEKNETNKNKKIYFNTVNNNKLSQDSGLFEISWNLDKVDANKVKCARPGAETLKH